MEKPTLLAFDVNETLLSLDPVKEKLTALFGENAPVGEWFARMLHGSLVANETGSYRSFGVIGAEALLTVASRHSVDLARDDAREVLATMNSLPTHPDVYNAMERLFDAGFAMITLTNGSTATANAQVEAAGLHPFLRRVISVEEIGKFKPAAAAYVYAAEAMGVAATEMMLVAAHDWDCAGAMHAGARAAFVARPGMFWSLPSQRPELVVDDISELADALLG